MYIDIMYVYIYKCLTSQLIYQADVRNNKIATTKARLKMKTVKTVRNCRNMFGH